MKLTLCNIDTICVKDGKIAVVFKDKEYLFAKEEIEAAMIITTDKGPFYDDMCLAIRIDSETAIFVMSEHPCYKEFLFDELKTLIKIDYNKVIEASTCTENNIFFIYKRDDL
ncbi:MAG: hypothetical protein K2J77_00400 [Oscillospiraceae bacterium]|nr:hypothetical protein [Oscillospiraceae bacterium]